MKFQRVVANVPNFLNITSESTFSLLKEWEKNTDKNLKPQKNNFSSLLHSKDC